MRPTPQAHRLVPLTALAVLAVLAGSCGGNAEGRPSSDAALRAAATIRPEELLSRIGVMAHDSMRGRATPSPELDVVAEWIGREFAEMGLEPTGDDGTFIQRFPLPNGEPGTAPNVVGLLPGSDPDLRDEYVVYSAHMDHVGVGPPNVAGTDSIYNGADDDASGTATVMEVAEALASLDPAPRRSFLFVIVSGEERGLWGSDWFASNPPVPVTAMVANLNADMVGRNWTDTIVAIGKEHSSLGETLNRVNRTHPELGMTAVDDLWPEERFYFRSDHFNFARRGVPVLFFFNGTHEDYHQPSDHVEKIDADKAARIGRLLFHLGLEVAEADDRPEWDPESRARIVEVNDRN
jgi:hypothetical protein